MQEKINFINSLKLDERISYRQDLILLAQNYLVSETISESQSIELINCLNNIRTSRFVDSDIDMELLDISLLIARKLQHHNNILKGILNDILYYSNYYPKKYNKEELEVEIKLLNKTA